MALHAAARPLPALRASGIALAAALLAGTARADLPIEQVTVATLPPANANRLYLSDMAISHFVDGKLMILDGDSMKMLGQVSLGMAGQATLSPDRSEILVSTTYFTKLNRGERIAELDVYDATTLKLKAEINVPAKHAQAMPYRGAVRTSADGRWVFLQNATPATSVTVVDRAAGKFAAEVPTPGCWMIYPPASASNRFSTLCGDGTLLTVTLDDAGQPVDRRKSRKFFDADDDALFVSAAQDGDTYLFVSFKGRVQPVDLSGTEAQPGTAWSLLSAADGAAGWRPGGYQPLALHAASGRLYVGMHPKGKEGSHKEPAREIWAFDLARKARVARLPGEKATVVAASQGDAPKVFGLATENGMVAVYDAGARPRFVRRAGPFSEFGTQIDTH